MPLNIHLFIYIEMENARNLWIPHHSTSHHIMPHHTPSQLHHSTPNHTTPRGSSHPWGKVWSNLFTASASFLFNINFQSCCSFHATQAIDDLTNHRHSMIRAGKHLSQTIDQQRCLQDSLRQAPSRCLAMLGPSPKLISCMLLSQSTL